ncbi:MAG: hypothetical protein L0228_09375 [Planctomycetes bacterium]|nr:hypothetical protein [Planctomycetota bacterium]
MAQAKSNERAIKQAVKEALMETLHEQKALLREVFAEVLEDFALVEAVHEGRKTGLVSRDAVLRTLRSK